MAARSVIEHSAATVPPWRARQHLGISLSLGESQSRVSTWSKSMLGLHMWSVKKHSTSNTYVTKTKTHHSLFLFLFEHFVDLAHMMTHGRPSTPEVQQIATPLSSWQSSSNIDDVQVQAPLRTPRDQQEQVQTSSTLSRQNDVVGTPLPHPAGPCPLNACQPPPPPNDEPPRLLPGLRCKYGTSSSTSSRAVLLVGPTPDSLVLRQKHRGYLLDFRYRQLQHSRRFSDPCLL